MMCFKNQLVVLLLIFTYAHGSCFLDTLRSSTSAKTRSNDSTMDEYCEYPHTKHPVNSTWTLPYPDCLTCECSSSGLECCGYGIEAGINEPPEHCQLKRGTCDVILVEKDDPSELCKERPSAKPSRLFKKKKFHSKRKTSTVLPHH